ncbi:MAG: hypothetical protein HXX20_20340 [Chloroflexi bacterium]|nr:hypothetical protein [Chloroflexota bacterium]
MFETRSNKERVGIALDFLLDGLRPFLEQYFKRIYGVGWEEKTREHDPKVRDSNRDTNKRDNRDTNKRDNRDTNKGSVRGKKFSEWDAFSILKFMAYDREVFSEILDSSGYGRGRYLSGLAFELFEVRNKWAHGETFTLDDAYRVFDSAHRLLMGVSAPEAMLLRQDKKEVRKLLVQEDERGF